WLQLTKNTPYRVIFRRQTTVTRVRVRGAAFHEGATFLRPSATAARQEVVRLVEASPDAKVVIVGHVYPSEADDRSNDLSLERARVVRERLAQDVDEWLHRYDGSEGWDEVMDFMMVRDLPGSPRSG